MINILGQGAPLASRHDKGGAAVMPQAPGGSGPLGSSGGDRSAAARPEQRAVISANGDTAFVGRTAELERMNQCLRQAWSGKASSVLVQGPAGIGKTALLRHWLAGLAPDNHPVLRAACDTAEEDLAYGVIGQLTARVPAVLLERFPLLAGTTPTAEPFHVGAQLLELVGELQSGGPVLIVVDDIQWADRPSAQALGFVLRRLEADAVLTVLLARSSTEPGRAGGLDLPHLIAGMPHSCDLTLTGLDTTDVAELAERAYGRSVGRATVERLRDHTDGHALYLRTLLTEVSLERVTHQHGSLPVPTSLAQALRRQLDVLPGPARSLVEGIAVLSGPAPLATAARIASVTESDTALEPLLANGMVRWWPSQPFTPVTIGHALQRDAILDAITPRRLRALHAAAAPLVDRAASWSHRVAATHGSDAQLARELELAAAESHCGGEAVRAATLLLWASDVAASREEQERLLLIAAARLLWAQQYTRVEALLDRIEAAQSCPLRSLVLGGYGTPRRDPGAAGLLTEALKTGPAETGAAFVPAMAGTWLGIDHVMDGRGAQAEPLLRDVLAIDGLEPQLAPWALGSWGLARSYAHGPRAALREFDGITRTGSTHSAAEQAIQRAYRGMLHMWAGDLADAQHELTAALDTARSQGCAVTAEFTYANLAASQYFLGHWDEAVINADLALAIADAEEKPWAFSYAYCVASWVPAGRGQWQRARRLVQESQQWTRAISPDYGAAHVALAEAVLAQARGDHAAILTALRTVLRARPDSGPRAFQAWWRPLHVEALIGSGELDGAAAALADLVELGRQAPSLRLAVSWLSGRLAQERGDNGRARDFFTEGLEHPACADDPPLHRAMLAHSHGRLLTREGERQRAAVCFTEARELLTALGAQPFLTRCQDDFTNRPPSPHPAAGLPLSALTDRERDISQLIGRGLTNREIAVRLFVSSKTVEYHLSHIYQKFSLTGRRELRNLIQQHNSFSA
ncbi:AAA family ATPase [Streptomyces sp. NPDC008343]|uniref:helix-turn-helix transcriptional regulator n=1 Tax=Streptomyces sp. NPDC008343 TaxID=3364828 RepID=UPI0036EAA6C1